MGEIINKKNIIKSILIISSAFFWIYFLVSSKLTMQTVIIFDVVSMLNSMVTINFLLFIIFFPLTSVIILSVIFNSSKQKSLMIIIFSLLLVIIISAIFFNLNLYFILFLVLYLVAHVIACIINQNDIETKKTPYNLANEMLSKVTIFLIIAIFIASVFYLLPNQKSKAEEMEAGIVNLFVSDDLGPWIGTSYTISKQCTKANLEYIQSSDEYLALTKKTDTDSIEFTEFLDNLNKEISKEKTIEEIKASMPDLSAPEVKTKVITTIKQIPFMTIIENYFAVFFALMLISIMYSYLSIVFLIFAALIYVFNMIFKEEN
ncbi:MAG: hypothetical protein WCX82_03355 [archaeon]|jgi:hypothetical protein